MKSAHEPVLVEEVLSVFAEREVRYFFDGTVGAGGHARALLTAHPEIECYVGCDRDPEALRIAAGTLAGWKEKIRLVHGKYSDVRQWIGEAGVSEVQGFLIDAGVSSMQLDQGERGFSFWGSHPLDMRMDSEQPLTAAIIVNRWREEELARILREYGEEPKARAIARAIVEARKREPIRTTEDLVEVVRAVTRGKSRLHPATLTFQAIRIAVNDELDELRRGIEGGIGVLCPMGRIVIISFHRLEDRIAKNCLRNDANLQLVTKKPLTASQEEVRRNPRCRSAKLRAAERV